MARLWGLFAVLLLFGSKPAWTDDKGRWQQVEAQANCIVWNNDPQDNETVTWSGACERGKAHGQGSLRWRYLEDDEWKVSKYTGEMKDGKEHGRGVYVEANGDRYEGEFRNGKRHGHGVVVWTSGASYEGDWRDGNFHGRGVIEWPDGDRFGGQFRDGSPNGRGTFKKMYGESYSGYWTNGCFEQGNRQLAIGTTMVDCGFQ